MALWRHHHHHRVKVKRAFKSHHHHIIHPWNSSSSSSHVQPMESGVHAYLPADRPGSSPAKQYTDPQHGSSTHTLNLLPRVNFLYILCACIWITTGVHFALSARFCIACFLRENFITRRQHYMFH